MGIHIIRITRAEAATLLEALRTQAKQNRANSRKADTNMKKAMKEYNASHYEYGASKTLDKAQNYRRQRNRHAESADAIDALRNRISHQL